jgi:hypothetical protein
MNLTFKQYLESKQQLKQALSNIPVAVSEHEVIKYCSVVVGESKEESKNIALRPKQKIIIEWCLDDLSNPTINYIQFDGVNSVNTKEKFNTFWEGIKLKKWLKRYTKG